MENRRRNRRRKPEQRKLVINMYEPYASLEYYQKTYKGSIIPADEQEKALRQASRHIDSLTYNRIMGRGIDALTDFQRDVIREAVCRQAEFEYENADEISTVLSSYSINGVSAQFGSSWNIFTDKGIAMMRDTYSLLEQTGLCCRLAVGL